MKRIKLGDVLDVRRGTSLPGKNYSTEGNLVRLTLGNFDYPNGGFKHNSSKDDIYYNGKVRDIFILKQGDIITPLTEQVRGLLGEVAIIPEGEKYVQSGDVGLIIPYEDKIDRSFAAHLVSSNTVKKQLADSSQQTKIRHTSPEKIKECAAFVPESIDEQKRIGRVLDIINARIANLRKTSETLERYAGDLFGYWFFQFNFPNNKNKPYKESGGDMVYNEDVKREIPVGWKVGNLYDIASFTNGITCQKYRPIDEKHKLPVIKIREMHNGFNENTEYVRSDIEEKHIVRDGDVIFSWSATLETMIWSGGIGGLNQHIFKITSNKYSPYFAYEQLNAYIGNFIRMAEARKTTMGHITKEHLAQSKIVIPPSEIETKYAEEVKCIYARIVNVNKMLHKYVSLRDWLSPLLMSGQVRIRG